MDPRLLLRGFFALSILLPSLAAQSKAPTTIPEAIEIVRAIRDPDPHVETRKRAIEAMKIVSERVAIINHPNVKLDPKFKQEANDKIDEARTKAGMNSTTVAWEIRGGRCEEHADLLRWILKGAGVADVELKSSTTAFGGGGHTFLIVDAARDFDPDLPWTWGPRAFIPDTWTGILADNLDTIWEHEAYFGHGKYQVGSAGFTTRQKLQHIAKGGLEYLETHCDAYRSLYDQYKKIPEAYRDEALNGALPPDVDKIVEKALSAYRQEEFRITSRKQHLPSYENADAWWKEVQAMSNHALQVYEPILVQRDLRVLKCFPKVEALLRMLEKRIFDLKEMHVSAAFGSDALEEPRKSEFGFPPSDSKGQDTRHGPFTVTPGKWFPTGIRLEKGQRFRSEATGTWKYRDPPNIEFGPSGGGYWMQFGLKAKLGEKLMDLGAKGGGTAQESGDLELGAPASVKFGVDDGKALVGAYHVIITVERAPGKTRAHGSYPWSPPPNLARELGLGSDSEVGAASTPAARPGSGVAVSGSRPPVGSYGGLLFESDLSAMPDGARALFGSEAMSFQAVDGKARLTGTKPGVLPVLLAKLQPADFVAEFDLQVPGSGYNAGLVFRARESTRGGLSAYYAVGFQPDKPAISLICVKDGAVALAQEFLLPGVRAGGNATHRIKVDVSGTTLRCFVDSQPAFDLKDETLGASGPLGFFINSESTNPGSAYFDNMRIFDRKTP